MAKSLKWKLIENAGWLFVAELLSRVLAYGIIVVMGRTLGPEGLGLYSFIFYYVGILGIFSDFGINFYITKEVSKDKNRLHDLVPVALGLKIFLAFLNFIILAVVTFFLPKPLWVKLLILAVGAEAVLYWVSLFFSGIMYAHEVTKYESIVRIAERVWAFATGVPILYHLRSLKAFVGALIVGYAIRDSMRIYFTVKLAGFVRPEFRPREWLGIIRKSYPFWLINLFTMIYYQTDVVMLNLLRGNYETGIYRGAYMFVQVALLIPGIVIPTILPPMARLWEENKGTVRVLFNKAYLALLGLGILGAGGLVVFPNLLISIFLGSKFLPSIPVLKILGIAVPFMFLNSLIGSLMNATGKELEFTKIVGFTALLNVVLNYILIMKYGVSGAATATVISQAFVTIVGSYKAYQHLKA
ncbi:peptide-binding protein [Thermococcus chitonophagus]|uniref:Multi antimicrobial extrusion protein (Na(+)/drug antiporter), MATE family of MDR efflux pumps n=1 Tax=Thermococcus chitonophagus TaxID=54262 RepID=A0A160VR59_9EURY|nr:flippase [Thermococcus chitonophagus]ASJ16035.1 peptide-binding protein [Thermococcus chitonophagus]CUX77282.1 Multi antimicrobial extrusion protein (Na(+)/drug antiporter), MATE family of MDR efflux pumps [Thermococcus chitonophagus]